MNFENQLDKLYIGSGIVHILDAINSTIAKENVLVIDKSPFILGAWHCIDLFGIPNVENAVHYLLPNDDGYNFINNFLKIELSNCQNKFFARNILGRNILLPYNNPITRIISNLDSQPAVNQNLSKFISLTKNPSHHQTKYPKKGALEFTNRLSKLCSETNLNLMSKSSIEHISVLPGNATVVVRGREYNTKQLFLSHGFIPPSGFTIDHKQVYLNLKKHKRPSIHFYLESESNLVEQDQLRNYSQALFPRNSIIKYVHELTQFLPIQNSHNSKYILVVALRHDLTNTLENRSAVLKELENFKLIPMISNCKKIDYFWQDIFLPMLHDSDLFDLQDRSFGVIKPMFTDELCSSIGKYSLQWNHLKKFLNQNNLFTSIH